MKVTLAVRTDKNKINGVPVELVEIVDSRVTVILPTGRKADYQVSNLVSFDGEVSFDREGQIQAIENVPGEAEPAPLFDAQPEGDAPAAPVAAASVAPVEGEKDEAPVPTEEDAKPKGKGK